MLLHLDVILKNWLRHKIMVTVVALSSGRVKNLMLSLYGSKIIRPIGNMQIICKEISYFAVVDYWFINYVYGLLKLFFVAF